MARKALVNAELKIALAEVGPIEPWWSDEDDMFIFEHASYPAVIGAGDTKEEAFEIYSELLQDHLEEVNAGRFAAKPGPGRPQKFKVKMTVEVASNVKEAIVSYAEMLNISQGEVIEYLVHFHDAAPEETKPAASA